MACHNNPALESGTEHGGNFRIWINNKYFLLPEFPFKMESPGIDP